MDYTKLTLLIAKHRIKVKEIADVLGITPQGYYYKIQHETITLEDIEKLAKFFKVHPSYFKKSEENVVREQEENYAKLGNELNRLRKQINVLKEILAEKESEVSRLKDQLL